MIVRTAMWPNIKFRDKHPTQEELFEFVDYRNRPYPNKMAAINEHVGTCAECKRYVESLRSFRAAVKDLSKQDLLPLGPCPDSWTFASYVRGETDDATARALNAHVAFCGECFGEYMALNMYEVEEMIAGHAIRIPDPIFDEVRYRQIKKERLLADERKQKSTDVTHLQPEEDRAQPASDRPDADRRRR